MAAKGKPSLLAEALSVQTTGNGPRCTACQFVEALEPDTRTEVEAMLAHEPRIQTKVILTVLERHGFTPPTLPALARHRRGDCRG